MWKCIFQIVHRDRHGGSNFDLGGPIKGCNEVIVEATLSVKNQFYLNLIACTIPTALWLQRKFASKSWNFLSPPLGLGPMFKILPISRSYKLNLLNRINIKSIFCGDLKIFTNWTFSKSSSVENNPWVQLSWLQKRFSCISQKSIVIFPTKCFTLSAYLLTPSLIFVVREQSLIIVVKKYFFPFKVLFGYNGQFNDGQCSEHRRRRRR